MAEPTLRRDLLRLRHEISLAQVHASFSLLRKEAEKPGSRYIWRTQGDGRVRSSHAANEGRIFAWNEPPPTGHPGTALRCRCWAEPFTGNEYPINDPPIESVYPLEEILLGGGIIARRIARELLKRLTFRNIFKRPKNVPDDWKVEPAKKKEGVKYVDPENHHNYVRIQRGNPNSPYPGQRVDYVKWQRNGQSLDVNGKPVPSGSPEAHIPLQEFKFLPEIFK